MPRRRCPRIRAGRWFLPIKLSGNQCAVVPVDSRPIGCGSYACAYPKKGDSSRVIKVTRDKEDVAALLNLKGKGLTPKVYKAYEFKLTEPLQPNEKVVLRHLERISKKYGRENPGLKWPTLTHGGKQRAFVIEMERVKPVTKEQADFIHTAISSVDNFHYYKKRNKPHMFRLPGSALNSKAFCENFFEGAKQKRCKKFVARGVYIQQELIKNKIFWEDRHSGNWGITKDGRLVALDLGGTQAKTKKKLKLLSGFRWR